MAWVLLAMPYRTFMPKFVKDVMGMDASGLGILMAAPGVGGLISSLVTASLGDFRGKGRLLLASGVVLGTSLFLFANIPHLIPVLLFLSLVGASSNACMVVNNCLLQVNSHDGFRGRVMSVYMMVWGLMPLGSLPAGAIADRMGVPFAVSLEAGLLLLTFLVVGLLSSRMRRLD
jgi:predicted MFS family arabinose efflux permease